MSEKKSVPSGKRSSKTSPSTAAKKSSAAKRAAEQKEEKINLPLRVVFALVCVVLFIVFLVIAMGQKGFLLTGIESIAKGLIGATGFYVAIPALLYLVVILGFSGNRPVLMRSVCLLVFVFMAGCLAHLTLDPRNLSSGFALVADLYIGGGNGTTGGVLCGLFTMLIRMAVGTVLSYILFILTGVFSLLAAMQITITSIIRAIQNRPRPEMDKDAVPEPKPEPAALVVNHLANKHIDYVNKRKQRKAEQLSAAAQVEQLAAESAKRPAAKEKARAADMLRQIDCEIDTQIVPAAENLLEEPPVTPVPAAPSAPVPETMPAFVPGDDPVDGPVFAAPAAETPPKKVTAKEASESAQMVANEIAQNAAVTQPAYCFPPVDLLKRPAQGAADGTEEMRENSRRLNETLASFKIEAHIINVTRGPSVTRYEVELEKGVRLNKLTTAADDIALSLGASGVRITAVPGKISVVGIEVPNRTVTTVSLRDVIDSAEFSRAKSKSSFAVGKDMSGNCIVGNIAKLPHMLIAGTTGSGKSVCMNSIIISLLYKASPEDVKLIMVDPKMVELGIYNGIPHLLIPVVTDPKKAAGSLQWAVTEMLRRYRSMSDVGVRDLESYNSIIQDQEGGEKLPQIVVIIDELADLMLVAAKEVEESICRIAQMGRAAGIHLVIATQRPSADVITGLMKANIPSRIAFAVASAMESRIILDTQGAEKLVGKGDMLYAPIGTGKPKRVQGCFVSDSEVEAVANYIKANFNPNYDQDILEEINRKAEQAGSKASVSEPEANAAEMAGDEMLPAAVDVILETGQASVSMLQRRLKLGYARAARIVDEMEEKGIVGPFVGSKPREIRITKEQWQAMQSGQTVQMSFQDVAPEDEPVPEEIL